MNIKHIRIFLMACGLVLALLPRQGFAQQNPGASTTGDEQASPERDGQHDFDPLIGAWKFHLMRRLHPLTGSNTWVESEGTGVCFKIWDSRAELDTVEIDDPVGHIEGLTLRLYDPQTHQWSLYWATSKSGALGPPTIGEFKNGRGEFFDTEPSGPNGRSILCRFVWSEITPNSAHFEQSFSDDGGKTWEVNWITDQTRVLDESDKAH